MRREEHTNNESGKAKGTLWEGLNWRYDYVFLKHVYAYVCASVRTHVYMYECVQVYISMCIHGYIS